MTKNNWVESRGIISRLFLQYILYILVIVILYKVQCFPSYLKTQCIEQQTKVRKSFSNISSLVKKAYKNFNFNCEEFSWAWFTVNTRAVYLKNSLLKNVTWGPLQSNLTEEYENLALVPFLDMFNHSSNASMEAGLNLNPRISESFYEIKTNDRYTKFEQVFINYGPHGNLRLYIEYGFAEENNQNDFVPITITEIMEAILVHYNLSSECMVIEKALKILQKNKLHENLRVDHSGPSWNIAASLFVINNQIKYNTEWHTVYTIEDFSDYKEISSQQMFLIRSKLKELTKCVEKINHKLNDHNGCKLASKSFKMALNLLNFHLSILESAVKGLAQNRN